MEALLRHCLSIAVRNGLLTVTTASGTHFECGDGSGEPVRVRFTTERAVRRLLLDPELAFGELYMDGELMLEQGSIADLIALLFDQPARGIPRWAALPARLRQASRRLHRFNRRRRAQRNVAHHYD